MADGNGNNNNNNNNNNTIGNTTTRSLCNSDRYHHMYVCHVCMMYVTRVWKRV